MQNKTKKLPEIVFTSSNAAEAARESDAWPYIKMLTRAQQFSESIDFSSLKTAELLLESCNAFKSPMEGKLRVFV